MRLTPGSYIRKNMLVQPKMVVMEVTSMASSTRNMASSPWGKPTNTTQSM